MFRLIVLVIFLVTSGLAVAKVKYQDHTIGSVKAVTKKLILNRLGEEKASTLLKTPYDGFYQISGKYKKGRFYFNKVKSKKSFPDDRWEAAARTIAGQVNIPVVRTGSRISPRATAYVFFYKDGIEDLDLGIIRRGATSVDEAPNALAVLMIKQNNAAKGAMKAVTRTAQQPGSKNGSSLYFFEVII